MSIFIFIKVIVDKVFIVNVLFFIFYKSAKSKSLFTILQIYKLVIDMAKVSVFDVSVKLVKGYGILRIKCDMYVHNEKLVYMALCDMLDEIGIYKLESCKIEKIESFEVDDSYEIGDVVGIKDLKVDWVKLYNGKLYHNERFCAILEEILSIILNESIKQYA